MIEKKESDPITLIDDLDTSVSYKQLTAVEKDNLTWRIEVYKNQYIHHEGKIVLKKGIKRY